MKIILAIICLTVTAASALFYFYSRKKFLLFFKTQRWSRNVYYSAIFSGGYLLGMRKTGSEFDLLTFLSGLLLMNILFIAALMLNNIYDKGIDRVNKKENTLNARGFKAKEYSGIFFILAGFSLIISLFISWAAFLTVLLAHTAAYVYSCPPLRLKKTFILNTLLIGFSSVLAILLGFCASAGKPAFSLFPWGFGAAFNLVLLLAFNTKDVNDYAGDKKYGIKTVMTVFGPRKGRVITAVLAFCGYALIPLLLNSFRILLPSAVLGALTFALIMAPKKKINEPLIFLLFFIYAAIFALINPLNF